jgi:hypothetical protein
MQVRQESAKLDERIAKLVPPRRGWPFARVRHCEPIVAGYTNAGDGVELLADDQLRGVT